nr:Mbeg1-like protein [Colidextribacter sp. OB.20]
MSLFPLRGIDWGKGGSAVGNILDYLAWRGDLSLAQAPFGPADALALAALSYIPFDGLVGAAEPPVPLGQAARAWLSLPPSRREGRRDHDPDLLRALGTAPRFGRMGLCCYASRFLPQEETQFAALTALMGDGSAFLAFRGTDGTLVGWKEDFNLSFLDVVPAQRAAAAYIEAVAAGFSGPLVLGGHSKGGNLAVAGASLCPVRVRDRIRTVYAFDSPGFTDYILSRPGYQELRTRIRAFLPQSSVVGLLLDHQEPYTVVQSDQEGLFQHDLYSWQLSGAAFVQLEQVDEGSRMLDHTLKGWLAGLTCQQRETVADTLYELLSSGDARTVREALEPKNLAGALRSALDVDPGDLLTLAASLARLAGAVLRFLPR